MKNIIFYIFLSILLLNTLAGFVIDKYNLINLIFSNLTIVYSYLILYFIYKMKIKNAFKIALSFTIPVIWVVSFISAIIMSNSLKINYIFLFLVILLIIQLLFLIVTFQVSKITEN